MVSDSPIITIRRADLTQTDQAADLVRLMDEYASGLSGGNEPLPEYTRSNLAQKLAHHPTATILLAHEGSLAVGLLVAFEGFSTFQCRPLLNIHDVMVTLTHRSRGIAKQLIAAIEAVALEKGCCKLTLEVLSNNLPAIKAYEGLGYSPYELDPSMGQAQFWEKKLFPQ
jgi:ribosomal protein S18 acetylase RimI-like enzyme